MRPGRHDRPGGHPLIGHRAPDVALDDVGDPLPRRRRGALATEAVPAAEWGSRVRVVTARPPAFPDQRLVGLVRPDGYLAWASVGDPDERGLREAMTTWLGPPGW
ncbi:hypothetical protein QRX60_34330 [Amycolatopsis mongoliensis]|uniref:Monooxygenase n=1 Tax=Amycolatopsis mongoliensis TaxID=715475 RepID=A0A9Y2JIG2_9PSEU|nr:hypothetical protein [Amycolatopsis sp. 4-36]WIX99104.1 hypothetical protein QRX60_34330 [Amycolatopsis sp. 4-36]